MPQYQGCSPTQRSWPFDKLFWQDCPALSAGERPESNGCASWSTPRTFHSSVGTHWGEVDLNSRLSFRNPEANLTRNPNLRTPRIHPWDSALDLDQVAERPAAGSGSNLKSRSTRKRPRKSPARRDPIPHDRWGGLVALMILRTRRRDVQSVVADASADRLRSNERVGSHAV